MAVLLFSGETSPVTKLSYEYLMANKTITFSINQQEMQSKLHRLEELVRVLKETREFVPRRNQFCGDCLVGSKCTEFKTWHGKII